MTFSNGAATAESTESEFRLIAYEIANGTTGGTVEIQENNCQVLRYFLSATNDVELNHRPAIGGFYDLQFQNNRHNFTIKTNSMSENDLEAGKTIDLTQDITDFKTLHDVNQKFYVYFFCPFLKVGSQTGQFKVKWGLNNNELNESQVNIKTKERLQNELVQINSGKEVTATSTPDTPPTLKEKWDAILAEVKSGNTSANRLSRMTESPDKYYSVIRRTINLKVGTSDAPNVEKVRKKIFKN